MLQQRSISFFQVAKWTGDLFNKGIYDIHIHLRGVPLLEWETEVEMDKWDTVSILPFFVLPFIPQYTTLNNGCSKHSGGFKA